MSELIIDPRAREKLARAVDFAAQNNLLVCRGSGLGLLDQLSYLAHYGDDRGLQEGFQTRCTLDPDFAEHSFLFNIERRTVDDAQWAPWMFGGLIYHGPLADGTDNDNLSVTLDARPGWQTHT